MLLPLSSLRNGQARTLNSFTMPVTFFSEFSSESKKLPWKDTAKAGASAFVKLATNTISGSMINAFTFNFWEAACSKKTTQRKKNKV